MLPRSARCARSLSFSQTVLMLLPLQLKDVLETIDTELSSTSLTPSQLAESKIFLFVTPQRKICAAAVVQRIKVAFEVVTRASDVQEDEAELVKAEEENVKPSPELLRFGEDEGAIFCSCVPFFPPSAISPSDRPSISQPNSPPNPPRHPTYLDLNLLPPFRPCHPPPQPRRLAPHLRLPDPARTEESRFCVFSTDGEGAEVGDGVGRDEGV
jgi:hypothetical protein